MFSRIIFLVVLFSVNSAFAGPGRNFKNNRTTKVKTIKKFKRTGPVKTVKIQTSRFKPRHQVRYKNFRKNRNFQHNKRSRNFYPERRFRHNKSRRNHHINRHQKFKKHNRHNHDILIPILFGVFLSQHL